MSDRTKSAPADPLAAQIAARLEDLPNPARIRDRAELSGPIDELTRILGQLDALPPERHNDDLRDRVEETRRRFEDKRDRLKVLEEARLKVEDSLVNAQRLHDSGRQLSDVVEPYQSAAAHVRGLRTSRDWDDADLVDLSVLEGTAESARQRYLNDHEVPTTRQEGEGLVAQILSFAEQIRKDPTYSVTYFSEALVGAPTERMEVQRAIVIARTLLFNWWLAKIADYLETARQKLDIDHMPRDARGELQKINQLPGRNNPEIGRQLTEENLRGFEAMRARVDENVRALDTAESELRRAIGILESTAADALEADSHYQLALAAYPFASGLEETRARIVETARREIDPLLDTAGAQLKREAWVQAALALDRVERLLALQPPTVLPEARARYDTLRAVYENVKPLTARPRTLSPTEERELLQQISIAYADDYWPGWESLARDLIRLQTLRNLQTLGESVNAACKPGTTVAELEYLAEALADLQKNPPANAPKDKLAELPVMTRRVESWLGYARARDELAKAPKTGVDTSVMPDDLELDVVADLQVAAEGLRQASMDRLAKAAADSGHPSLTAQLERMKVNDTRAARVLAETNSVLDRGGRLAADDLSQKLEDLKRELGRPNSHRQGLLVAYHELRQRLTALYRDELQKLLAGDRANYYANLSDDDLGARMTQLKQIAADTEPAADNLAREADMARSMARAQRIEVQVAKGVLTWEDAKEAWKTAREKAELNTEPYNYALHRERQAYKLAVFKQTANARDETTVKLLQRLTEDEMLSHEWDVWYRYGSNLVTLAQVTIAPNRTYEDNDNRLPEAQEWVETARAALRTADALTEGRRFTQADEIESRDNLTRLITTAEEWDILLRAFDRYRQTLKDENPRQADFLNMIATHDETDGQLNRPAGKGPDAKRWHNGLWAQVRGVAQVRLETRLKKLPPEDILGRLNALLSLVILSPDNSGLRDELANQSAQILHALQTLVNETIGDYGGAHFSRRFLASNGRSPAGREHLDAQLMETRQTIDSLEGYRQTLARIGPTQFPVSDSLLTGMSDRLAGWKTELEAFRNALDEALRVSADGLRDPSQFDKAHRILRVSQNTYLDETQVPPEFINANHPTYRWAVENIGKDFDRRRRQEALRDKIVGLIRSEQSGVALALRARGGEQLSKTEWEQVEGLRDTLKQLRESLREMIAAEDKDATQLQGTLRYPLPEDREQYYSGAHGIEQIILAKLEQYRVVAAWLAEWADPHDNLLNVIDWPKEMKKIATRRNRGPGNMGLNEALRQCREALGGAEGTGRSGDRWALRPAHDALSPLGMVKSTGGDNPATTGEHLWYGVIEPLNRRRAKLQATLADHIADNERMEANIIWRSNNYQARFDTLVAKKEALLAARKLPWKVWEEMPAFIEFRRAVEEFCVICPDYQAFIEAQEDARRHTGKEFYCPEGD